MKQIAVASIGLMFIAVSARAEPAAYWQFEGNFSTARDSALTGRADVLEKGVPPVFDSSTPAPTIWNGATYSAANPGNRSSLRFVCEGLTGAGSPYGGEVTIAGGDPRLQPSDFTVEAFVKMNRQSPRHAIIVSKRRGASGASWLLSIDPEGRIRARFDTQPDAQSTRGEGFNQSVASTGSLSDHAWHHVALTYDHATRSAAIYVDYVRCGGGVTNASLAYDAGALVLGRGLDGWLDEVRLTAEALHPEQFLRTCRFFSDIKPRMPTVAMLDQTPTRVQSPLKPALTRIGTLTPKHVGEIETSTWSLGCETLDRDLASWDAYEEYLLPLGIRRIRVQGGWNRTEKKKGEYDFEWLDRIVDDAHAMGLQVCLETSYNNTTRSSK